MVWKKRLTTDLMTLGIQSVILIDMAGNVIVNLDDGKVRHDVYSLAALAAGKLRGGKCHGVHYR